MPGGLIVACKGIADLGNGVLSDVVEGFVDFTLFGDVMPDDVEVACDGVAIDSDIAPGDVVKACGNIVVLAGGVSDNAAVASE